MLPDADILVVVPTYNERDNLPFLAGGILAHPGYGLLVVDDASPDGTGQLADALAASNPGRISVIHRTGPTDGNVFEPRPELEQVSGGHGRLH